MSLRGVQARFTDPNSGTKIQLAGHEHQLSDYVMALIKSGLQIEHMSERTVTPELAAQSERAAKYQSWPMLLLIKARPA